MEMKLLPNVPQLINSFSPIQCTSHTNPSAVLLARQPHPHLVVGVEQHHEAALLDVQFSVGLATIVIQRLHLFLLGGGHFWSPPAYNLKPTIILMYRHFVEICIIKKKLGGER